jgi:thiamine-monophosphate kinase
MKLSRTGELALLEKIRKRLSKRSKAVLTGIGDDAAVLKSDTGNLAASTDMMLEGVHFDLRLITPRQLGFKLISVNVSDIYAMGGEPAFALLGIAASGDTEEKFIDDFLYGVKEACAKYKVSVVGGDVSSSKKGMAFSATLMGHVKKPVMRSGAKAGHGIYVTGTLGDSSCGLELLKRIGHTIDFKSPVKMPLKWSLTEPLLRKHLTPSARRPGAWSGSAAALIDLSDGLLIDLTRLCTESGVGARIYADRIPLSKELIAVSMAMGRDPMGFALSGGEDYEMLFAARTKGKFRGATRIGEATRSKMSIVGKDGKERPFGPEGYQHFR